MSKWELTTKEVQDIMNQPGTHAILSHFMIATAAVKKYQEWLAAQCGPDPCWNCPYARDSRGNCFQGMEVVTHSYDCGRWQRYEGQQAGYAKAKGEA